MKYRGISSLSFLIYGNRIILEKKMSLVPNIGLEYTLKICTWIYFIWLLSWRELLQENLVLICLSQHLPNHTNKTVHTKGVASLSDMVASPAIPPVSVFNNDSVQLLHSDESDNTLLLLYIALVRRGNRVRQAKLYGPFTYTVSQRACTRAKNVILGIQTYNTLSNTRPLAVWH